MKAAREIALLAGVFVVLLALYWFTGGAGRSPEGSSAGLGGLSFPALGAESPVSLDSCATPKCLTAYVAPWCGVCRASTDLIIALRSFLIERGVDVRIVVGRDKPGAVEAYAKEFGPGTLMDPSGRFPLNGGVPQFIVTDAAGQVLVRQPGLPRIVRPPIPQSALEEIASFLRVP